MAAYRIIVVAAADGTLAWDSGVVNATSAVGVPCGADLRPLATYRWTAQWWSTDGLASPTSSAAFELGPSESDWAAAPWVGAPLQKEFRLRFTPPEATAD
eukprot:SAG22_NODE_17707_length_300_cov_0.681592_1_plen_99_part_11